MTGESKAAAARRSNPWVVLSVTSVGALLAVMNQGTINVALPVLLEQLQVPVADVGWIVMSYMLALSVSVVHVGKVSDMFGRKRVFLAGLALFTLSSVLAGSVDSAAWIIVARLLQGIGGASLMSNATAMVTDVFPVERRGKGLGINSMVISSGALLGPIVGGFLVNESWRWVFWFNVPFGVLLFFWGWRLLPNRLPKREKHDWHSFDLIGTVSLLSGLVGVLGAITYGTMMHAGGMAVLLLLLLGFSSFSVFIWQEQRAVNPIVRFDMFRQRTYSIANITTFFNAFARMSVPFILIFYLQGLRGFSPLQSGLAIIPMAAAMTLVGPYSGILADRIGARIPASMGLLISAVGLFSLGFISAETPVAYLIVSLAFVGCGSALFLAPNVMSIMNIVPPEYRGVAAGTRTMLNNFGTLFSLSVSVALLGQVIPESGLFGQQEVSQAQSEAFLFTVRVLFIGGGAVSVLAACLSWLREPDR